LATYDRQTCEDFVERARVILTENAFVELWAWVSKGTSWTMGQNYCDGFVAEWINMPIWNKQAVLFLMAPHIDRIARDRAKRLADKARIEDPE